jgi:hypothetical protein
VDSLDSGAALQPIPSPFDNDERARFLHPAGNLIEGVWRAARDGETSPVQHPGNGQVLPRIASSGSAAINDPVSAARAPRLASTTCLPEGAAGPFGFGIPAQVTLQED